MDGILPSLAALRLGAPTGPPGSNERSMKVARVLGSDSDSDSPPPPPPDRLADLPAEVIEMLVTQAALAARKAHNPAEEICEWMKRFCRAATKNDLKCQDDWFRLALAAFGYDPAQTPTTLVDMMKAQQRVERMQEYTGFTDTDGNPAPPPELTQMPAAAQAFRSWRHLFSQLCEAFSGSVAGITPAARAETGATFWDDASRALFGQSPPPRIVMLQRFLRTANANQPQRKRDTFLDALLEHVMPTPNQGPFERVRVEEELVRECTRVGPGAAMAQLSAIEPWRAVVALLITLGAKPFKTGFYTALDQSMYGAVTDAMLGQTTWTEALPIVQDALNQGANPNYMGDMQEEGPPPPTPGDLDLDPYPPMLTLTILSSNGELIDMMLAAGALRPRADLFQFLGVVLLQISRPSWSASQESTEKLLSMLDSPSRSEGLSWEAYNLEIENWPER